MSSSAMPAQQLARPHRRVHLGVAGFTEHLRATATAFPRSGGPNCLQRSLATTLLCRARGTWPSWIVGVRTPPFAAHAWVDVGGRPVGEPAESSTYRAILAVRPMSRG
ncbi:lasso peptide biosynthesis B2 protein [Streptomyces decoyicus]|uniref:lasso peptide biosynthesis B2 protein n=1 Tax=Streptomyces decoyicus TaxID=249567 RepID=UPI00380B3B0B